jgi:hypothetical protein
MEKVYRNSAILIALIIIGVQWGFYRTYTSQFPNFIDKTNIIHIHGALLMTWLVLLVVQPLLIATGRSRLHRMIGKSSYVLGPLIIISLFLVGQSSYLRSVGKVPEDIRLAVMVLDIRGFVSFTIFWTLAMLTRKEPSSHMRYMIATGILAIGPGVGRGLAYFNVGLHPALTITDIIEMGIVSALLVSDIKQKKNYKPYLVVFIVLLVGKLLWQVSTTPAWQSVARAYANLFF